MFAEIHVDTIPQQLRHRDQCYVAMLTLHPALDVFQLHHVTAKTIRHTVQVLKFILGIRMYYAD